jgi:aurora kinase
MSTIAAITRQISALELASKKQPPPPTTRTTTAASSARPGHSKQPSQSNVPRLLTKFVAPHPHQTLPTKIALKPNMDIGKYDGGFELDDEKRGEKVYGEAAEALALDSSVSGYYFSRPMLYSCRS